MALVCERPASSKCCKNSKTHGKEGEGALFWCFLSPVRDESTFWNGLLKSYLQPGISHKQVFLHVIFCASLLRPHTIYKPPYDRFICPTSVQN